jgi:hypothetical protein
VRQYYTNLMEGMEDLNPKAFPSSWKKPEEREFDL